MRRLTSAPAHARHDAERARVVAADLDRDPRPVVDLAPGRQRRRVRLVLLEDLDDGLAPAGGLGQQRRARARGCGCRTRRPRGRPARRSGPGPSGPGSRRPRSGGPAGRLERLEPAQVPVELVVGVLPDAAGVEDDDVGVVEPVGRLAALVARAAPRSAGSRARSSGTRRWSRRSGGSWARQSTSGSAATARADLDDPGRSIDTQRGRR